MKKWHWILLGVFTYLLCLIIYMPAIYVTNYAQQNTQNSLSFENVEGTLFTGMAQSVTYGGLRLNDVNWDLSPFSLLLLTADLEILGGAIRKTEQIYLNARVKISLLNPRSFSASYARIIIPVKPLLAQVELPVSVIAAGRIGIDIDSINYDDGCQELSGKGSWIQATMTINTKPLDLGGFSAVLSCEMPAFAMQISPDNGIELDAKIVFEQNGKYSAIGQFVIPDNFPNEVKQGAGFFGESKGQGRYELNINSN
jgi:general secretion pathway protein N